MKSFEHCSLEFRFYPTGNGEPVEFQFVLQKDRPGSHAEDNLES